MRNSLITPTRLTPPPSPSYSMFVAAALALSLGRLATALPIPEDPHTQGLYTLVDEETGETREKGLPSGTIAGVVVAAVLGFSLLFGLLWCWLDRQQPKSDRRSHPNRKHWPWQASEPSSSRRTRAPPPTSMRQSRARGMTPATRASSSSTATTGTAGTTSTTSTTTTNSTLDPKVTAAPVPAPSPTMAARMSRMYREWKNDDAQPRPQASDDSLPQYVQVIPPPKAHVARRERERKHNGRDHSVDHGRVAEWCAKKSAAIKAGKDEAEFSRVRSWEEGDPEKKTPDPFTA